MNNIVILGDSYSTFEGYIPDGHSVYYKNGGGEASDVSQVEHTWWYGLCSDTGANLILNNSFSGSTVCNTGYGGKVVKETSYIGRFEKYIKNGFFNDKRVDTFIVFGGTNDSWADSPVGILKYDNWTEDDLFSCLPAFTYLLSRISEEFSDASVVVVINSELKAEITAGMLDAANHFNATSVLLADIDKADGHPTIKGMGQIKEQILQKL